jgi:hypothetical protein
MKIDINVDSVSSVQICSAAVGGWLWMNNTEIPHAG